MNVPSFNCYSLELNKKKIKNEKLNKALLNEQDIIIIIKSN